MLFSWKYLCRWDIINCKTHSYRTTDQDKCLCWNMADKLGVSINVGILDPRKSLWILVTRHKGFSGCVSTLAGLGCVLWDSYYERAVVPIIGSLSKLRWWQRQECRPTKSLMSRTMAVHAHYKSLYISLPSSTKRWMCNVQVLLVWGTEWPQLIFVYFHLELNAVIIYLAWSRFYSHCPTEQI